MYYLTRMLYTKPFALGIVLLLCLGSTDLISRELKGVGEYPETELFAALISLIVAYLALSFHTVTGAEKWRLVLYGVLGLIVGLALWVDLLILPLWRVER